MSHGVWTMSKFKILVEVEDEGDGVLRVYQNDMEIESIKVREIKLHQSRAVDCVKDEDGLITDIAPTGPTRVSVEMLRGDN